MVRIAALVRRSGSRLTVKEIAREFGLTEVTMRRRWRLPGMPPLRDVIILVRLGYAARLIVDGTKIEAAMRLAGFRNWTNFNRQFRRRLGGTPAEYRAQHLGDTSTGESMRRRVALADDRTSAAPTSCRSPAPPSQTHRR
jgi:AraC-like DNA-binding protein